MKENARIGVASAAAGRCGRSHCCDAGAHHDPNSVRSKLIKVPGHIDHHIGIFTKHFIEKGREAAQAVLMIGNTRAALSA